MSQAFTLHPQLEQDTVQVVDLPLMRLRLMNDCQYPWLIGVPRRPELREVDELSGDDQAQWLQESLAIMQLLRGVFSPDKINMATLGNMVPQLHVHYIARYSHDPAWPRPVWGVHPPQPYTDSALQQRLQLLRQGLSQPNQH